MAELDGQGQGVIGDCPQAHRAQFGCVKGGNRISAAVRGLRALLHALWGR